VTTFARRHNIPVWSGSSNTAVHMLHLAGWVHATQDELTTLAHSIFAFWRVEYDHTSLAPHTLHEVMDVAQNFGIPYNPLNQYAGLGHQNIAAEHDALLANITARWHALEQRMGNHEDAPQLGQLVEAWQQQLEDAVEVLENFAQIDPDERTEKLADALRYLALFDIALKGVERNLANAVA
jgi:hypothetical protein